jgi:ethanolamine utilization protein EutQ (cupin superfamily)
MKKSYLLGTVIALSAITYGTLSIAHAADVPEKSPKMQYIKNAKGMKIKSMDIAGTNAYLEDLVSSNDPKAPITCALFRMEKGNPLTYTYTYDESKVIIEGSMYVADGYSKVKAKTGDVLFFPKGATITFSSDNYGIGYVCGQRARDGA